MPQRRTTAAGSPHTAVAWLSVGRRSRSPRASGMATMAGAHAGSAAWGAASTVATRPVQAVVPRAIAVQEGHETTQTAGFHPTRIRAAPGPAGARAPAWAGPFPSLAFRSPREQHRGPRSPPQEDVAVGRRRCRRRPWLIALAVVLVALLAVGIAAAVYVGGIARIIDQDTQR